MRQVLQVVVAMVAYALILTVVILLVGWPLGWWQ